MLFREILKLIPKKIYRLGVFSIGAAVLTAGSIYGVAILLQVFSHILGFSESSQINPLLLPLEENVSLFFLCFTVVVLVQGVGQFLQSYMNIAFAETFNYEVRKIFLEDMFRSDSTWNYDLGTTSNMLAEVIPKGASFVTSIARFITLLAQIIILGIFCLNTLPYEFMITLGLFLFISPITIYLNRKSRKYGSEILERSKSLNNQLMRAVKNFLFLKILGLEKVEKDKILRLAKAYYNQFMRTTLYYSTANALPGTFSTIIIVALFYVFSSAGEPDVEANLLTLFYLLFRFAQTLSQAVAITNGLNMYYPNFRAVLEILHRNKIDGDEYKVRLSKRACKIGQMPVSYYLEADDLSFSYDCESKEGCIYKNLNFRLPEGKFLVIKGSSGSGKTTLLMNLIGVLKQVSGKIQWGGVDISAIDFPAFKSKIGYMGPEPYIISGTAYENMIYGLQEIPDDAQISSACRTAESDEFIDSMKYGLQTRLTEQGEGLSMGQKQRLGLARALLRQPKILVLDEITANLDKQTEKAIVRNIAPLKSRMTILAATHSTCFDQIADLIIDLSSGSNGKTDHEMNTFKD